jgi:RHS repeat-associated protein
MKTLPKPITIRLPVKLLAAFILCFAGYAKAQNCVPPAAAPTSNQNYIITYTPRVSGITNPADLPTKDVCEVMQQIQYFDGLGRLLQTVQVKATPAADKDLVAPVAYDGFGREVTKYMPYASASTPGSLRTNPYAEQLAYYAPSTTITGVVRTTMPYVQQFQELSPLNRPLENGAPGTDWQPGTHTVKSVYTLNDNVAFSSANNLGSRQVVYYTATVNADESRSLNVNSTYNNGDLTVTITKDENWVAANGCVGTTEQYTDKEGHVVLKRTYNLVGTTTQMLSTYYVYDDFGLLCFVLTPGVSPDAGTAISQTQLDNLCYQYQYDERNRQTQKKIPGKGWEFTVYNYLDQAVATQDALQRTSNEWLITKYDGQGRTVLTGIWNNSNTAITRPALQTILSGITTNLWEAPNTTGNYYTNVAWPTSSVTATLNINYYDGYSNVPGQPAAYSAPAGASTMTRGLQVAAQTAVLNTPADVLWKVNYYDDLNRAIKTYAQHYMGGHTAYNVNNYDAVSNTYNFTNQVTAATRKHYTAGSLRVTIANTYAYDQMGRKLNTGEQLSGSNGTAQPLTYLSLINYNEIGQLYQKTMGANSPDYTPGMATDVSLGTADAVASGQTKNVTASNSITLSPNFSAANGSVFTAKITGYLQTIAYSYNERGWLTALTPAIGGYAETINYNNPTGSVTPQYNGNISQFIYNSPNMETANGHAATAVNTVNYTYDAINRLRQSQSTVGASDETLSYDPMGNIQTLNRSGTGTYTGSFAYAYNSGTNQLHTVKQNSNAFRTYGYDVNGNASSDNTGDQLTYNLLNLPMTVTVNSTLAATYTYDADGDKLRDVSTTHDTWDYAGGIVYKNGQIDFIQTEEGKALLNADSITYTYNYDLKDYLGNVRATYDNGGPGGALRIVQEDDYYPFGLNKNYYNAANNNRYLYNGKEQQLDLTDQYDYGARFYDPIVIRWNIIDPLAEKMRRYSPYNYDNDNPIINIDDDGMLPEPVTKKPLAAPVKKKEQKLPTEHNVVAKRDATVVVPVRMGKVKPSGGDSQYSQEGGWAEWQEGGQGSGPGGLPAKNIESKDITGISDLAGGAEVPDGLKDIAVDLVQAIKDTKKELSKTDSKTEDVKSPTGKSKPGSKPHIDSTTMYVDPSKHDTVDEPTQEKRSPNNLSNWTQIRGDEYKWNKTHSTN